VKYISQGFCSDSMNHLYIIYNKEQPETNFNY